MASDLYFSIKFDFVSNFGLTNKSAAFERFLTVRVFLSWYCVPGYPCEYHEANTTDGYILGMFRLPWGQSTLFLQFAARKAAAQRPAGRVLRPTGLLPDNFAVCFCN